MKPLTFFSLVFLSGVALSLTGCGESKAANQAASDPAPAAVYKAGRGLQLTDTGRKFIHLEIDDVTLQRISNEDVAAIPSAALLRTVRGDFVYVANGDWLLRTPVVVGKSTGAFVEVKDGLYEGDRVVIRGVRNLALAEIQAVNGGVGCADGH